VIARCLTLLLAAAPEQSIDLVAASLAATIVEGRLEAPIGLVVEPASSSLARALGSTLSSRLSDRHLSTVPIVASSPNEGERIARAMRLRSLVHLSVAVEGFQLVARGDAISTWVNFWSGRVPTRNGRGFALAAKAAADAVAYTLAAHPGTNAVTRRPLTRLTLTKIVRLAEVPAAIELCDVNADGRREVVTLVGETLLAHTPTGELVLSLPLTQPRARRPSREPFGALVCEGGALTVWSSGRTLPERFDLKTTASRSLETVSVGSLVLRPENGVNRFGRAASWNGQEVLFPASPQSVTFAGQLGLVVFDDGSGTLLRDASLGRRVVDLGSGSVLADLDGDGGAELIATSRRSDRAADELRVFSLTSTEFSSNDEWSLSTSIPALRQGVEGSVITSAAGDLDGDGVDEIVLGTWHDGDLGALVLAQGSGP
jgi:hypothetical protein